MFAPFVRKLDAEIKKYNNELEMSFCVTWFSAPPLSMIV